MITTHLLFFTVLLVAAPSAPALIPPTAETAPVATADDAADDPAIWLHPTRPEDSLIIGTNKKSGLAVYDLSGAQVQYLPGGEPNNVDLRSGFSWEGHQISLITAGDRSTNSIRAWTVDVDSRRLRELPVAPMSPSIELYGSCMFRCAKTGQFYFIATAKDGLVQQWRLSETRGVLHARPVRSFRLGGQCEGCVADDPTGRLYIGEEIRGIWALEADPQSRLQPMLVDAAKETGPLVPDIEGLAFYRNGEVAYLIASSQGSNAFIVYDGSMPNVLIGAFAVGESEEIDAVSGTDGIECISAPLGGAFPGGLFVAQDDENPHANQNFKLVSWDTIRTAMSLRR